MRHHHPERTATKCQHFVHPSSSSRTPLCPRCTISAAQADFERVREAFEAEGGQNAPACIRDRDWNIARLRCLAKTARIRTIMRNDCLRRERERVWEEAHQTGVPLPDDVAPAACAVCAKAAKLVRPWAQPIVSSTTAWWEREGALVVDSVLVPEPPTRSNTNTKFPSVSRPKHPSYLRDLIKSYRNMRSISDAQRQAWEERCKIDRAIRRKYDLPDDFELEPEFLAQPIPAPHARYHHKQAQNYLYAGRQRASRQERRAKDYRPSRSSLALSELAGEVELDDSELETLRLAEEAAEQGRLTNVVATEVGYLYFVGDIGLLEMWKNDVKESNLALIYRKDGESLDTIEMDEDHATTEEEGEL